MTFILRIKYSILLLVLYAFASFVQTSIYQNREVKINLQKKIWNIYWLLDVFNRSHGQTFYFSWNYCATLMVHIYGEKNLAQCIALSITIETNFSLQYITEENIQKFKFTFVWSMRSSDVHEIACHTSEVSNIYMYLKGEMKRRRKRMHMVH